MATPTGNDSGSNSSNIESPSLPQVAVVSVKPPPFWTDTPGLPEAIPVPDIQACTVASAVYNGWISCFGTPSVVITDQGSQFQSNLFTELAHLLGIKQKRTSSNNSACNGFVERWHHTLKTAITCHANMPKTQWTRVLPDEYV
ncbi:putative retrotransposable element [Nephila pilipes]|uniref:Putative retrotransposable element n=1 Tax=Nephila pilipes TaxID=299642 RepID=A0A8X6TWQ0_NEPPI|nr:putative retrotransposable element [Nephila pilipes]